jgi:Protein of unknown function (DUF3455)
MLARWSVPLVSTSVLAVVALSACQPGTTPVPAGLAAPTGNTEILRATGRGVQIYTCTSVVGATPAWTLKAPEAVLSDAAGTVVANHGAGPSWTAPDGSGVVGTRLASADSPTAEAIPWLLLSGKPSGTGVFGKTTYIQRLDTVGGVAPVSGCDTTTLGTETRVNYSAVYVFFSAS